MHRPLATFDAAAWSAAQLVEAKGISTISVCLPARNEAATVGSIVSAIRRDLMERAPLVDELLVIDDHSTDDTAMLAEAAGATVVDARSVLADHGSGHGKGEALWKSLHVSTGDLVVWCDADISGFDTRFVSGLIGPLLSDPSIAFSKGFYERTERDGVGGGRVTELTARPLLEMFFPELTPVVQPLSGEYAGRRSVLEQLPFTVGYGVDLALLIDVARLVGTSAIAQVDLGERVHRNRTLAQLGPQARAVMQAALVRAGAIVDPPDERPALADLRSRTTTG